MDDNPSIILTVICDDMRQEVGGKSILIGVYAGGILFETLPVVVPTLSIYMEVQPKKPSYERVFSFIKSPSGEEYKSNEGPAAFAYAKYNGPLYFRFPTFTINEEGHYGIYLVMDSAPILARTFSVIKRENLDTQND